MSERSDLLIAGLEYPAQGVLQPTNTIALRCIEVKQRNWSRVGLGLVAPSTGDRESRWFIKQSVDRTGYKNHHHWTYEQMGAIVAGDVLGDLIRVPALQFQNERLLLNVLDYVNVISMDELLREDAEAFYACFPSIMNKMVEVLEALKEPPTLSMKDTIPTKRRAYGGPSAALNFKGFEIRNVGITRTTDGSNAYEDIAAFDFARPYLGPIEEAAAKLLVSIGLLNWGKPLSRFVLGPETKLLQAALEPLGPYLDRRAIQAELKLQSSFRTTEFHGSGPMQRTLKKAGINTVGRIYLRQLSRWCENNVK